MESMSVLSFRCCMFVSCMCHEAVINAAFCMTCSLLMLVEDARPYGRGIFQCRSHDCLIGGHEFLLLFVYPILFLLVLLSFVVACVLVLRCCECVCCM